MTQQPTVDAQCPECGSHYILEDKGMGELVCNECGVVLLEDIPDTGPEWRAFTLEETRARKRAGPPIDYSHFDKGLTTSIDGANRDATGRPLPAKTRKKIWRLRKWDNRSKRHTSQDRNLAKAMIELQRLSEKLDIPPSVQKTAALFYRRALRRDLIRGRSIASIVAASLYVACRFTKTPKSLKEVAEASLRKRKDIARGYRLLVRELNIKMPTHDPLDYLNKIAERAGISSDVQGLAVKILNEAKRRRIIAGKEPRGVAAAALYIAGKQRNKQTTQKTIADAANISEVTLRNRQKDLADRIAEIKTTHYPAYLIQEAILEG
jgi:transcription initiation factor TFIIB